MEALYSGIIESSNAPAHEEFDQPGTHLLMPRPARFYTTGINVKAPKKALVAHRDHSYRNQLCLSVAERGFHVIAVRDGAELLEAMADAILVRPHCPFPDLIVTELALPERRGDNVLTDLRSIGWRTPVTLIARRGEWPPMLAGDELEPFCVLKEPVTSDELLSQTRAMLERAAAKQAVGVAKAQRRVRTVEPAERDASA